MEHRGDDVGAVEAFFEEAFNGVVLAVEFADLEGEADLVEHEVGAGFLDFFHGRDAAALDAHVGEALDVADLEKLAAGDEGEGHAAAPRAAGAADAVDVVLDVVGEVVVEDGLDVVHVDAARGHVGGDEEFEAGLAELVHHAVALGLVHVAVQTFGGVALRVQVFDEFVHHALGVAEDDAELEVVNVDEAGEDFDFPAAVHLEVDLLDGGDGHGRLLHADVLRGLGVALDEVADGPRHGGAEEDGLARGGRGLEDVLDVVAEAHVQHDVGLVEDEHLELVEAQGAALHVVHDAAGGADDNLRALAEADELAVVGLAAVDGQGVDAALKEGEFVDLFADLDGELAGGAEDEDLDGAELGVGFLNGRDGEGGGLAGTGLGLADDVLAGHQNGDGGGLDGRGLLEAKFGYGFEEFGGQAELGEQFGCHAIVETTRGD